MAIKLKKLTAAEQSALEKLARARTAPAREVERARLILLANMGKRVPAIAQELELTETTVRTWLKRFNEAGLDGLQDRPRAGRPVTYQPEQVAEVIATALTDPRHLNQPFACWTLDRLATYLNEEKKIALKRSRIDEVLIAEGLRWRTHETWFGARVDPEFAKKRGAWTRSTPTHLSRVRSCAWIRGGRSPPRVLRDSTWSARNPLRNRQLRHPGPRRRLIMDDEVRATSSVRFVQLRGRL